MAETVGDFKGLLEGISLELVPPCEDFQQTYGISLSPVQQVGLTFKKLAENQIYFKAVKGDLSAIKDINDRMHGKSKQTSDEVGGDTYEAYLERIGDHDEAVASGKIEARKAVAIVDGDTERDDEVIIEDPYAALRNAGFI